MIILLDYREDGTTRTSISVCSSQRLTDDLVHSLFCLLEGWPQGGKALVGYLYSHDASTAMEAVSSNSLYLSTSPHTKNIMQISNAQDFRLASRVQSQEPQTPLESDLKAE
jgi:hypothetical protein